MHFNSDFTSTFSRQSWKEREKGRGEKSKFLLTSAHFKSTTFMREKKSKSVSGYSKTYLEMFGQQLYFFHVKTRPHECKTASKGLKTRTRSLESEGALKTSPHTPLASKYGFAWHFCCLGAPCPHYKTIFGCRPKEFRNHFWFWHLKHICTPSVGTISIVTPMKVLYPTLHNRIHIWNH
jgi:hypothetical protein